MDENSSHHFPSLPGKCLLKKGKLHRHSYPGYVCRTESCKSNNTFGNYSHLILPRIYIKLIFINVVMGLTINEHVYIKDTLKLFKAKYVEMRPTIKIRGLALDWI